jgi:selenide,water dikinase
LPKGILSFIKCAGCASKLSAAQLAQALSALPGIEDPDLLVGLNTADDASVYRISDELALVYTVDILAPVVEDPFTFGQIAAANCISDVYAMGGDPKIALNIVGFPTAGDPKDLGEILRGGQHKAQEAGVTVAGGHTFNNAEIKYGMSVVGYINPRHIITNAAAKPGDVILLTKPIGVGTMLYAYIMDKLTFQDMTTVVTAMTTLNKDASTSARCAAAHAGTDITGYGLAGHLTEMAEASKVGIELFLSKIPVHEGALGMIKNGISEPGIKMNRDSFLQKVDAKNVDEKLMQLFFGAETSGGLAVVLPEQMLSVFFDHYKKDAAVIGRVTSENAGRVIVKP